MLVLLLSVAVLVYAFHFSQKPKLERATANFTAPVGSTEIGRRSEGSWLCFISCDEPRVRIVYRTDENSSAACTSLRDALMRESDDLSDLNLGWDCSYTGPLNDGGSRATVGGSVLEVSSARSDPSLNPWVKGLIRDEEGYVAVVVFNSGLD